MKDSSTDYTDLKIRKNKEQNEVCKSCPQEHACREVWSQKYGGPFSSGGLVLMSIAVFVWPILTAIIAGAAVRRLAGEIESKLAWEIIGAVGGLMIGVLTAWFFMVTFRKKLYAKSRS